MVFTFWDIIFVSLAVVVSVVGLLGSVIPIVPGPPLSWLALLLVFFAPSLAFDWHFLTYTFVIMVIIFIVDFIIPSILSKKMGGSKKGSIGTVLGLFVGFLIPIPIGFLIGAFLGAYIGELFNKSSREIALKAAIGSFLGLLFSTFMKVVFGIIYLYLLIKLVWIDNNFRN